MDIAKAWYILEMEPTQDASAVKARYRELLPAHNPEDDPEGFKALREAYEFVLAYLKNGGDTEKDAEDEKPKDEIDLWVDQIRELYRYMDLRTDVQAWKEKLNDPLCIGLDTTMEVRERLLVFLMDHHYLPMKIWKLLDDTFCIAAEREDLLEKFPKNYIDYVIYQTKNETFGSYAFFSYQGIDEAEAEYDRYIDQYYGINGRVRELDDLVENARLKDADRDDKTGDTVFLSCKEVLAADEELAQKAEQLEKDLEQLAAYEVYHPYEDLERLHLAFLKEEDHICKGGSEESLADAARRLLDKYIPAEDTADTEENDAPAGDPYILRVCGEALAECGRWEEAYLLWKRALAQLPEHTTTLLDTARYYRHSGDLEKAETIIRENISSLNGSIQIKNFFLQLQQDMHDRYQKKLAENPDDIDAYMEYCWALFHSNRTTETLNALDQHTYTEGTSAYYDYVDMKGRCYLDLKRYEEALPWLHAWEKALKELPDDGSEKYQKRKKTLGYQCFTLADCCFHLAIKGSPHVQYQDAENYIKMALETEEDRSMRYPYEDLLARIYLRSGQNRECVELTTAQIDKAPEYLPGYLRRQEAYFNMHNGQGVVDDYHHILDIYRDYYRPYVLAARVFLIYRQLEDTASVLKDAAENHVDHPALRLEELRYLRRIDHSDERRKEIEQKVRELLEKIKDREEDLDLPPDDLITEDDAWFELAAAYTEYDLHKEALEIVSERIRLGTDMQSFYMLRANLYRMMQNYAYALRCYSELAVKDPKNAAIPYYLGICYRNTKEPEKAMNAFKAAVALDPEEDRAIYELTQLYRRRFIDHQCRSDYDQALAYFDRLLELNPSAYVYSERANLLELRGNYAEAIASLKTALEKDPTGENSDDYLRYRLGDMYFLNRQPEKAEEQFRKAIEEFGGRQAAPIMQIADLYGSRGDWESGLQFMTQHLSGHEGDKNFQTKRGEFMAACGHIPEAEALYLELLQKKILTEKDYYIKLLNMYALADPAHFPEHMKALDPKLIKAMNLGSHGNLHAWQIGMPTIPYHTDAGKEYLKNAAEYYSLYGEYYLFTRQLKQARKCLEAARSFYRKLGSNNIANHRWLALCYKLLGPGRVSVFELPLDSKEYSPLRMRDYDKIAAEYARTAIRLILTRIKRPEDVAKQENEDLNTETYYLNSYECDNPLRYKTLATLHLCMGDTQTCTQFLDAIGSMALCLSCRYQKCYDAMLSRAYAAAAAGDMAAAADCFAQAKDICPTDVECTLSAYYYTRAGK
ncbi:MAG: tetratricopeptide repeat protein [Lachnospiraceae bacterium]|nr:tetratricopeptide repeat protein [Lachnospiraceae bacterium]